jgi:hypothetical protein
MHMFIGLMLRTYIPEQQLLNHYVYRDQYLHLVDQEFYLGYQKNPYQQTMFPNPL